MNSTKFISASELSRECGCSVGKILNAVETGTIVPDGRAGKNTNSAIIFAANRLTEIKSALAGGKPATTPAPMLDIESVGAKAKALFRAREEAQR